MRVYMILMFEKIKICPKNDLEQLDVAVWTPKSINIKLNRCIDDHWWAGNSPSKNLKMYVDEDKRILKISQNYKHLEIIIYFLKGLAQKMSTVYNQSTYN